MPSSWIFYTRSLSLSAFYMFFWGEKAGGGGGVCVGGSSFRVCGLASFMSCDHGCPSLHWVCVQIGGEESQNERVLVIMCMRVCGVPVCQANILMLTLWMPTPPPSSPPLGPSFPHTHTHTSFSLARQQSKRGYGGVRSREAGVNSI